MKLLLYEMSKVFSKKRIIAVILAFAVLNLLIFYTQNRRYYQEYSSLLPYEEIVQEELKGLSIEEASARVTQLFDEYNGLLNYLQLKEREDEPIFAEMLAQWMESNGDLLEKYADSPLMQDREQILQILSVISLQNTKYAYLMSYPDYIRSIRPKAEQMLELSIFNKEGTFAYNNIIKTPDAYEGLDTLTLSADTGPGLPLCLQFRLTDLFLLASLFLLCLYLFLHEEETGLIRLVRTAKKGRGATIAAKLGAAGLLSALLVLLFYGSLLILGNRLFGFGDLSAPVQSLEEFRSCVLRVSIGQYIGLVLLAKMAAALLNIWLIAMVFLLFRRIKSIFIILAAFWGVSALCYYMIPSTSWLSLLKYINIFGFLDVHKLLGFYTNLNFFSLALNRLPLTCLVVGVLLLLVPALCTLFYLKNHSLSFMDELLSWLERLHNRRMSRKKLRGQTSLFLHETRKILVTGRSWLFLAAALVLCLSTIQPEPLVLSDAEKIISHDYAMRWAGFITPEKTAEIEAEKARLESLGGQIADLTAQHEAGEISDFTYMVTVDQLESQLNLYQNCFDQLYSEYCSALEMEAATGIRAGIVDALSADYLFSSRTRDLQKAILFLLLIILTLSAAMTLDEEKGLCTVIRSTEKGRGRRLLAVLGISALVVIFLWLCVYLPVAVTLLKIYHLSFELPVQNLAACRDFPLRITIGQYALLKAVAVLAGGFTAAVCVLAAGRFTAKQGFCIPVSVMLLLFPFLALFLGFNALNGVTLVDALAPLQIAGTDHVHWLIYMVFCAATAVGGSVLLYKKE